MGLQASKGWTFVVPGNIFPTILNFPFLGENVKFWEDHCLNYYNSRKYLIPITNTTIIINFPSLFDQMGCHYYYNDLWREGLRFWTCFTSPFLVNLYTL